MHSSIVSKWIALTVVGLSIAAVSGAVLAEAEEAKTPLSEPVAAVSQFAGSDPGRCVFSAPGLQLCSWSLEGRLFSSQDPGDETLALNLICELGIEGPTDREPACGVHAVGPLGPPLPAVSAGNMASAGERLLDRIADAPTATALSRALGEIPALCRTGALTQRCEWQLPAQGGPTESVTLMCELPLDGSPRRSDSCELVEREIETS